MNLFDVLALIGRLCLFLFGMNTMGESLRLTRTNDPQFKQMFDKYEHKYAL